MTASHVKGRNLRLAAVIAAGVLVGGAVAVPLIAGASGGSSDPTITVTVGGDRSSSTTVSGLGGVTFSVSGPGFSGTCGPTSPTGTCTVTVPSNADYTITPTTIPSGWRSNATLGVGTVSPNTIAPTNYASVSVHVGTQNVRVPVESSGSSALTARGNIWALSRQNPPLPAACGLKVALLFDLSASIGSNLGTYLMAGQSFVSALAGTPSSVGVFTFATNAPASGATNGTLAATPVSTLAGAAAVNQKIGGLALTTGNNSLGINNGFTNWDQGLWQIASATRVPATAYNVAIVLTDGDPTRYGPLGAGGLTTPTTRLIEVENGIFSANALKASGTSVLAVGINLPPNPAGSRANLAAISGPNEGSDFFTSNFAGLGNLLHTLALANCAHTVNVTKLVVPAENGPNDTSGALPLPGWTFTASPASAVEPPAAALTNPTGAVSFKVIGTTSQNLTVTENPAAEPGNLTLFPVNGQNATCTSASPVNVPDGFTVASDPAGTVACSVFNQAPAGGDPASILVDKTWVINGVTFADGTEDPDFQASLNLTPNPSRGPPLFGVPTNGYKAGDTVTIDETVEIPPGCTNVTSGDRGPQTLLAGLNSFELTNTVTCVTTLTLVKQISNPVPGLTPPQLSAWTLTATPISGGPAVLSGTSPVTSDVPFNTQLVLTESSVPGWHQVVNPDTTLVDGATGSWECASVLPTGEVDLEDFGGGDGTVVVPPGEHAICTAINEPAATLTLVKRVINHGGTAVPADWTLTADPGNVDPPAPAPSGVSGSPAVTTVVIEAGIPYTLRESGPAGYGLSSLVCSAAGGASVPVTGNVFTAGFQQDITCTFTNAQSVPVAG